MGSGWNQQLISTKSLRHRPVKNSTAKHCRNYLQIATGTMVILAASWSWYPMLVDMEHTDPIQMCLFRLLVAQPLLKDCEPVWRNDDRWGYRFNPLKSHVVFTATNKLNKYQIVAHLSYFPNIASEWVEVFWWTISGNSPCFVKINSCYGIWISLPRSYVPRWNSHFGANLMCSLSETLLVKTVSFRDLSRSPQPPNKEHYLYGISFLVSVLVGSRKMTWLCSASQLRMPKPPKIVFDICAWCGWMEYNH